VWFEVGLLEGVWLLSGDGALQQVAGCAP